MSDLRHQIHDHYDAQSLSPDKVNAVLARGGQVAASGESKIIPGPSSARWRRVGLALAASVALLAGLAQWWPRESASISYAALPPRVVEFFGQPPELPKRSANPEELRAWLIAQGAPSDFRIPAKLQSLKSFGCEVVDVQGRRVYLACFWREKKTGVDEGELVHLLVARRADFRDGPASGTPQFRELDGWSFASWSEGDVIYTLAAAAPMETLRSFVQAPSRASVLLARLRIL
jgi:hypothetical protein